jgi:predicted MPP superfamily phosphohydrolase
MNRRRFLKRAAVGAVALGGIYPFLEAKWCRVNRVTVPMPGLPRPFDGTTIAFLTDVHHGPYVPLAYIRSVVNLTNSLRPDIVALGGDYCHDGGRYIAPGIEELAGLRARLGRFAVLGNHDHWDGLDASIAALDEARFTTLRNEGTWVEKGGARLRIGGVGDLWTDYQDVATALGDATDGDGVVLLSHNPDVAETLTDTRVDLMLSGHTHGGQIVVPGYGAPIVPSAYGQKYLRGLVEAPTCRAFISRGVGTVSPPVRFLCRPEVALLTLVADAS